MALTDRTLNQLLAALDSDRDRAGQKYEELRRKLLKFFDWRGSESPEDLVDQTFDRVSRRIGSGEKIRAANPSFYFHGVALNVLRESWARQQREQAALEALSHRVQGDPARMGDEASELKELERRLDCLERCLEKLSAANRSLILRYYEEEEGVKIALRKELAQRLGIPPGALRIRAHRIRVRLEACVQDCLRRRPPEVKRIWRQAT